MREYIALLPTVATDASTSHRVNALFQRNASLTEKTPCGPSPCVATQRI